MRCLQVCLISLFISLCFVVTVRAEVVGPYTGQVLDSRTGEPVVGASLLIYWVNCLPSFGGCHEEPIEAVLQYTDKEGRYKISKKVLSTGLLGTLESTHIIVYQPGYEAYIKRKEYLWPADWSSPAPTFPEKDNLVKLERVQPNFDHKEHYEDIMRALSSLDEDFSDTSSMTGAPLSFNEIVKRNKVVTKYWELRRRAEWEDRREKRK